MTSSSSDHVVKLALAHAQERNDKRRAAEQERNQSDMRYPHAIRTIVGPRTQNGVLVAEVDISSHEARAEMSGLADNTAHIRERRVEEGAEVLERGYLTETTISSASARHGDPQVAYVSQGSGGRADEQVGTDRATALAFAQSLLTMGFADLDCCEADFEERLTSMATEAARRAELAREIILAPLDAPAPAVGSTKLQRKFEVPAPGQ